MNWLKDQRVKAGILTQEELANRLQLEGCNVTRAAVSHWENERYKPPVDDPYFRRALADVLKISEPELLRMAGYEISATHSLEGERAAHIIDQLSPEQRELALKVLEQFL